MTKKDDAKRQAKYDEIIARNKKAEDRRQSLMAQLRGMSGHPSSETKRRGFHEMSDRELHAHGMVRTRGLFGGTTINTMETHQDKMAERQAIARERKEEAKRKAKEAAKRAAKKALQSKKPKKKGFFSW